MRRPSLALATSTATDRVRLATRPWPWILTAAWVAACAGPSPPRPVAPPAVASPPAAPAVEGTTESAADPTDALASEPSDAREVARWSRALASFPRPDGTGQPLPEGAREPLQHLRGTLDVYLAHALTAERCGASGAPGAVARCLEDELRRAGVDFDGDDAPWGAVRSVRVEAVPGSTRWWVASVALRLECSEDTRVMLYEVGVGARLIEPAPRLTEVYDGRAGARAWVFVPAVEGAAPLVLIADQNEGCTSSWRQRRLRVLAATRDPSRPREVWSHDHSMFVGDGNDGGLPDRLDVRVDRAGFTLAWESKRLLQGSRVMVARERARITPDGHGGVRGTTRRTSSRAEAW